MIALVANPLKVVVCAASGRMGTQVAALAAADPRFTLTAKTVLSADWFFGWGGDCASAGTHPTCTLVMTTRKRVEAGFGSPGCFFGCGLF